MYESAVVHQSRGFDNEGRPAAWIGKAENSEELWICRSGQNNVFR